MGKTSKELVCGNLTVTVLLLQLISVYSLHSTVCIVWIWCKWSHILMKRIHLVSLWH